MTKKSGKICINKFSNLIEEMQSITLNPPIDPIENIDNVAENLAKSITYLFENWQHKKFILKLLKNGDIHMINRKNC